MSAWHPSSVNSRRGSSLWRESVSLHSRTSSVGSIAQIAPPKRFASIYTASLPLMTLKFTTSEDEDEGLEKPTWTFWCGVSGQAVEGLQKRVRIGRKEGCEIIRIGDEGMTDRSGSAECWSAMLLTDLENYQLENQIDKRNYYGSDKSCSNDKADEVATGWKLMSDSEGSAAIRVGSGILLPPNSSSLSPPTSLSVIPCGTSDSAGWIQLTSLRSLSYPMLVGTVFSAGNSVFSVVDDGAGEIGELLVKVEKGGREGELIRVGKDNCPFVCGRTSEASLCISDRELSRSHFCFIYSPGSNHFHLLDLHSTNGTFVRLLPPYGPMSIGVGDCFVVGRTGFGVGGRWEWGGSESIGARKTMEDRSVVHQHLLYPPAEEGKKDAWDKIVPLGDPRIALLSPLLSFAGVFDGHGGNGCSDYIVGELPRELRKCVVERGQELLIAMEEGNGLDDGSGNGRKGQTEFGDDGLEGEKEGEMTPDGGVTDRVGQIMREIIKDTFEKVDAHFLSETKGTSDGSGSTASCVVSFGQRIFAANTGDSRVVICRGGGECMELTSDHKPTRRDEGERIRMAGGFVLHKRVMGELAVSRAFGDRGFKRGVGEMMGEEGSDDYEDDSSDSGFAPTSEKKSSHTPLVIATPEVSSVIQSPSDEFLILACDGLFDVFSSAEAVEFARRWMLENKGDPNGCAKALGREAIGVRRSRDNVSIIIIVLRPFWQNQKMERAKFN